MRTIWLALMATAIAFPAQAADKRLITVGDLDRLKSVGQPAVDPGGQWVAYSIGEVDAEADKNVSHIWMTSWDGGRSVQLTSRKGESESSPRWSPDGRYLAFISSRDDEKERDQLWLLDRTGGEAKRPVELNGSVIDYAWSPNGKQIALLLLDPDPNEAAKAATPATASPARPGEPQAPQTSPERPSVDTAAATTDKEEDERPKPIVIDRYQFKRDNDGYLGTRRQRLVLLDLASGTSRRLTSGDFDEFLPAWSPDGSRIAFVGKRGEDQDRGYNFDLFVVPASGPVSEPVRLTSFKGADNDPDTESYPAWSPDGRSIAYLQGGPVELFSYGVRTLAVVPATGGTPKILTPGLDRNVGHPIWSPDGKSLRVTVEDDGAQWIGRVPASGGAVQPLLKGRQVADYPSANAKGKTALLLSDWQSLPEVYALDGSSLRPLSRANDALLAQLKLAPVEETRFRSADGTEVHGFLLKPTGGTAAASGRVPTVLRIHGGPQSQFGAEFSPEWQILAANGYAVVAANPRGSTGRGQDYAKGIYAAWGSVDVQDVLAAVDAAALAAGATAAC